MSLISGVATEGVRVQRVTGTDAYGTKAYEEATVRGRIHYQRRKIINQSGEEAVSEAAVYLLEEVAPGDRVWANGRWWMIQSVAEHKRLRHDAVDHWEARL